MDSFSLAHLTHCKVQGDAVNLDVCRMSFEVHTLSNVYRFLNLTAEPLKDSLVIHSNHVECWDRTLSDKASLRAEIRLNEGRLRVNCHATHSETVKAIGIVLSSLKGSEIIADAVNSRWFVGYNYPCWWKYPVAFVRLSDEKFFCFRTCDNPVRVKRLIPERNVQGEYTITLYNEERALDFRKEMHTSPWIFQLTSDPAATILEHRDWMEEAFQLVPFEHRSDVPSWAKDISLVVILHGMDPLGRINSDYLKMRNTLGILKDHFPPSRTLIFIPGLEGLYVRNWPDFKVSHRMGGQPGLLHLMRASHETGYHIMPYMNITYCSKASSVYEQFEKYRAKFPNGESADTFWDWDRDGAVEIMDHICLNPGHAEYREFLVQRISSLIDEYGFDGIFMDQSGVFRNDPTADFSDGIAEFFKTMRERYPDLLCAGEGQGDYLTGPIPYYQVHGKQECEEYTMFSPLQTRYQRAMAFQSQPSPDNEIGIHQTARLFCGFFGIPAELHEGFLPTLSITENTMSHHFDEVLQFLQYAHKYEKAFLT